MCHFTTIKEERLTFQNRLLLLFRCSILVQDNLFGFANPVHIAGELALDLLLSP